VARQFAQQSSSLTASHPTELGVAAAVGTQLLEANLQLRQRHTSLLSKFPATPSGVPPSNVPFPGTEPSWIPELDASSPVTPATLSRAPSHSRRISVTPQALATLSEHNTDLLAQLTQIQDETSRANLNGKRKLRQLEKELAGLRAELEFAQQRNGELEEQIETAEHEKQMEDKRLDREARLKALRERASRDRNPTGGGVKDYAPAHPFSGSPSALKKTPKKHVPTVLTEDASSDKDRNRKPTPLDFYDGLSSPEARPTSLGPVSAGEFAIISQLLAKIDELENANREMVADSRERDERLRKATEEANAIRQAYENLEDEADDEEEAAASLRSMVFKRAAALKNSSSSGSLGRRYGRERGHSAPPLRGKGKEKERLNILGTPKSGKTRRALSRSLFEPPGARDEGDQADSESADDVKKFHRRSHSRSGSGDKTPQLRFVTPPIEDLSTSEISIVEDGYQKRFTRIPPSPLMKNKLRLAAPHNTLDLALTGNKPGPSPLSRMEAFAFPSSSSPPDSSSVPRSLQSTLSRRSLLFQGHTLSSELGSEFGEEWNASAMKDDEPLFDDEYILDGDEERTNPDSNFSGSSSQAPFASEYSENPAVAAIREALDPRNQGKLLKQDEHILPLGSLAGTPGETFFLLEHAVQARPTVWKAPNAERVKLALLGRTRGHRALPSSADVGEDKNEDPWVDQYEESTFEQSEVEDAKVKKESAYSGSERPTVEQRNRSWKRREAAKGRLERTAAQRLSLAGGTFDPNPNNGRQRSLATVEEHDGNKMAVRKRKEEPKDDAVVVRGEGLTANLSKPMVELWILLQAIIIMVVFVYSMARRGPRAILDAAEAHRPR
jgi:hypothetical protein